MPLTGPRDMFAKALAGGFAVGAFNINNMETVQGILQAAGDERSPVILQDVYKRQISAWSWEEISDWDALPSWRGRPFEEEAFPGFNLFPSQGLSLIHI